MKIKQKQYPKILIVAGVLVLVLAGSVALIAGNRSSASTESVLDNNAAGQAMSAFSFDSAQANGWYAGPANETSMTLFGQDSGAANASKTYFAIIDYRSDGESKETWLQKRGEAASSSPGYEFVAGETINAELNTSNGPIPYQLYTHQNKIKIPRDQHDLNEAEVHGYIPYGDGYIRVQGYATPASLLPEVIEAIKSYALDAHKLN